MPPSVTVNQLASPDTSADSHTVSQRSATSQAHSSINTEHSVSLLDGQIPLDTSQADTYQPNSNSNATHSVSWPPAESAAHTPTVPSTQPATTSSPPAVSNAPPQLQELSPAPNAVRSHPPLRPPPLFTGAIRLLSPAASPARPPAPRFPNQVIRVSPAVVVRTPPPPPPPPERNNLSTEDQNDALNLLDSLHAASAVQIQPSPAAPPNTYRPVNSGSVRIVSDLTPSQHHMTAPGGQPIMTLGDRRNLHPIQQGPVRFARDPSQFERMPYHPRKRPYQDYNQGFQYQGGGGGAGYY